MSAQKGDLYFAEENLDYTILYLNMCSEMQGQRTVA